MHTPWLCFPARLDRASGLTKQRLNQRPNMMIQNNTYVCHRLNATVTVNLFDDIRLGDFGAMVSRNRPRARSGCRINLQTFAVDDRGTELCSSISSPF